MGRDLSECDDQKKKATLFSQLKKTKRRKILNVGEKESHWTHSSVSISPPNETCNGFTCPYSHCKLSQHTLNATGDSKTYLSSSQSHSIHLTLVCTGWLCFVPLLPTFDEHLSRSKRCAGSWAQCDQQCSVLPFTDDTNSGQQS